MDPQLSAVAPVSIAQLAAAAAALEGLSRALTTPELARGATALARALGATGCELAVLGAARDSLSVLVDGTRDRALALTERHPLVDAAGGLELWELAVDAGAGNPAAWAYLPLASDAGPLGAIGLAFPDELTPPARDAVRALVRHVAAAAERVGQIAGLRDTLRITDEVIGILGHDLRNPVHAISLTVETLLGDHANEPLARFLVRIRNSAERMARLIDQLLDMAKARLGGGVEIEPARMDLAALARQLIDEVQPGAAQTLELEVRGDTWGGWDSGRLAQVLGNLLGNAVHHGSVDDPVQVEVDGNSSDEVLISVWNGGAIPGELLPAVFEPFRGTRDRHRGGLGLGLYIAQQIVIAHGGTIEVRSSPLDGTAFVVTLPRVSRG